MQRNWLALRPVISDISARATVCGEHQPPDLHTHWWLWCCPLCTPELHTRVSAPDPHPYGAAAESGHRRVHCPWCNQSPAYTRGRLARHRYDGQPCRGSGLSLTAAWRIFGAALRNQRAGVLLASR